MDTVKNQSITSLPRSPEEDRRARMIKYSLAMGIRMVCILSLLFVQGWWLVVMGIGAIVLPYIAVVLANVGTQTGGAVEAPTGREVVVRNPQAPIVVPPADEQPTPRPAEQSFPRPGDERAPQADDHARGWHFPSESPQADDQARGWHFPSDSPQGGRAFPYEPERPTDRPTEGQA
ncbi:DUF3099 domain-containing protein [Microbacteriaceae bacterium 4G12]